PARFAFFEYPFCVSRVAGNNRNPPPLWRELQSVPNQIRENLFEFERIASDVVRPSLQPNVDPNPCPFLLALEILEYETDHLVRVHLHELQRQGLVRDMGEVLKLGHQARQTLNVAADECQSGLIEQWWQIGPARHAKIRM